MFVKYVTTISRKLHGIYGKFSYFLPKYNIHGFYHNTMTRKIYEKVINKI